MANNISLGAAKVAKNDEFYTQYADIQKEINAYLEYNPDTFRDKVVLLPCDDPEWSNFTKFFAQNFELLGLKKLISTSYAVESKRYKNYEPTLFETESPSSMPIRLARTVRYLSLTKTRTAAGILIWKTFSLNIWTEMVTSAARRYAN